MQFAHPEYLWLLLLYVPLIAWYIYRQRNSNAPIEISTLSPFAKMGRPFKQYCMHGLYVLRMLAIGCVIIVLARPQTYDNWRSSETEGTDIVVALDISTSMLARDFDPNRFEAAKNVASQFVAARKTDNIGLVLFAGESFTAVPMTMDHATLTNHIAALRMGFMEDGTAIGDGIATAINRIKEGKAKSKSIILVTDGSNNTGTIAPVTAAEIASKFGIKVYTIGVGKNGMAPYPTGTDIFGQLTYVNQPVVIDEAALQNIASMTGGKYFRATDNNVLQEIFQEIDKLEKTKMDVKNFTHPEDDYMIWAMLALIFFVLEITLRNTWLRTIP